MSSETKQNLTEAINQLVNDTFGKTNQAAKEPATVEGQVVAYIALLLMAIIPIYIASFRSVKFLEKQHETGEKPESITMKDAMKLPLIMSGWLFGMYLVLKLPQEYIFMLLGFFFFGLAIFVIYHIVKGKEKIMNYKFNRKDIIVFFVYIIITMWYASTKHWIANNIIGLAFSVNGIEKLHLNSVGTGCILLIGLFVYDVFWVFGTNVMVTVAKNFDFPVKVLFPQDFLVRGIFAKNCSMLGLGDIVVPGIFIALLLRFDLSLKRNQKTYFYSSFIAYFLGLVATIVVMVVFQHPQPALLYLVPACITIPVGVAYLKGDLEKMFSYSGEKETDQPSEKTKSDDTKKSD